MRRQKRDAAAENIQRETLLISHIHTKTHKHTNILNRDKSSAGETLKVSMLACVGLEPCPNMMRTNYHPAHIKIVPIIAD